ncbi:MAG: hypothetical protein ABSH41_25475, partial [Syntrophobacteraceae bacterium]
LSAIFGLYRRPPSKSILKYPFLKFLKMTRWAGLIADKANQAPNLWDFKRSKANREEIQNGQLLIYSLDQRLSRPPQGKAHI